MRNKKKCSLE